MIRYIDLDMTGREHMVRIPSSHDGGDGPGPSALLSLKRAGDMAFFKRDTLPYRKNLFRVYGIDESRVFSLYQKHTKNVVFIPENGAPGEYQQMVGDGMVTRGRGNILCVTVADCLPVFLFDKRGKGFGVLHSGWKGTGIIRNGIDMMKKECGAAACDIRVVIGPGIGSCCYEVDKDRYESFTGEFGPGAGRVDNGKFFLDLRQANIGLLEGCGVKECDVVGDCTSCNPHLASFRRDGGETFTLMLALIGYIGYNRKNRREHEERS
ncbi:MAG: polyphenol oxidase family protein [Spirochaetales bacterium]|nr:polyphenol oxidase family protein [Spirochaetales bacterium]